MKERISEELGARSKDVFNRYENVNERLFTGRSEAASGMQKQNDDAMRVGEKTRQYKFPFDMFISSPPSS